jgi:hypothetical protein
MHNLSVRMRAIRSKLIKLANYEKNSQPITKELFVEIDACRSELLDIYLELHKKYRKFGVKR